MPNFFFLIVLVMPTLSMSSSAPWQPAMANNIVEEQTYKDLPPIVFSGSGLLYGVEAIVAASVTMEDASANLCVSILCTDGVVVLSTMTKSPHLDLEFQDEDIPLLLQDDEHLAKPCSKIAPGLYCATGGNAVDSQLLRDKIHQIAAFLYESADAGQLVMSSRISASLVARHVADQLHRPTQTLSAGPMLASSALIIENDNLWRVDPTGQFWKCRAACVGKGAQLAENYLVEHMKDLMTVEESIRICHDCIKCALPNEKSHWRGLVLKQNGGLEILSSTRDYS